LYVSKVVGPRIVCIGCVSGPERLFLCHVVHDPSTLCYVSFLRGDCLPRSQGRLRPCLRYSVSSAYVYDMSVSNSFC